MPKKLVYEGKLPRMSKKMYWECYPIIFFRLAQHSSRLLTMVRWQDAILDTFEKLFMFHEREAALQKQFYSHRHTFDATSWTEVSHWLEHAHLRKEGTLPYLLDKHEIIRSIVHQLIQVRRCIHTLHCEFPKSLQDEFVRIWEQASSLTSDQTLHAALSYTSWDFISAMEQAINTPTHLTTKKCRNLVYALSNYIARGSVKTCPLGFMCGTAIARFAESHTEIPIKVIPDLYVTVMPSRALLDSLTKRITSTLPLEQLGAVHLDVSHSLEQEKIVFWRTHRDSGQLVEELQAIKIGRILASVLSQCGEGSTPIIDLLNYLHETLPDLDRSKLHNSLQRLLSLHLLCPEAHLTTFSQDPLRETVMHLHDVIREPSEQNARWLRAIDEIVAASETFSCKRSFNQDDTKRFPALLTTLHSIGKEVLEETHTPSAVLSVDSYARIDGDIPASLHRAIEHAASLSYLLAAAAYPHSQECADREQFLAAFREAHGDDTPVAASDALNTHWNLLDSILARVMKADYKQISPVNSHTWPQPHDPHSPYGQIYTQLVAHLATEDVQHHLHLDPQLLSDLVEEQPRSATLVDVICRVASSSHLSLNHTHEVYIESVTLPGRVTHRHWNTLARLGEQEAQLIETYRSRVVRDQTIGFDTEVLPVEVLATPVWPKQQNVDQRSDKPPVVLALAEPIRVSDFQRVLRFKDIYLRYDSSAHRIISTVGPHGVELAMTYTSPISPSYNRRLHFLRYISLMGHPVLVAPKWFLLEASQRCHLPRIYLDNLVLTPERWAIPLQEIASVLTSRHWTQRYINLHVWRRRVGLPDICFAYTNRKTKPFFVDFHSPSGLQNVLELLNQEAEAILFEECYPDVNQQILQRGTEPIFNSIVATIRRTVKETTV